MTTIAPPITPPAPLTLADVARLSNEYGKLYERVDGQLVEKSTSKQLNWVATQISFLLKTVYDSSQAHVFVKKPTYRPTGNGKGRRPDVALVWADRPGAAVGDEEPHVPPDLVVDVVSPSHTYRDVSVRVEDYLLAGVPLIWVVGPIHRSMHVYRKDGSVSLLRESDMVRDEPLLPGLKLRVGDFFPAAATTAEQPAGGGS